MASPPYKAQEEGWSLSLGMEIGKGFKEKGETIWTKQVKQNVISFLASYWNYAILGLKDIVIISCHVLSHSVESDSLRPRGLEPSGIRYLWQFPGRNTGVGYYYLLQKIFLTQGRNPSLLYLLHCQAGSFLVPPRHSSSLVQSFIFFFLKEIKLRVTVTFI